MNESEKMQIYKTRFEKLTLHEKFEKTIDRIKEWIFKVVASSRFHKRLRPSDYVFFKNQKREAFQFDNTKRIKYQGTRVSKIRFFDVFEIDDFDRYKNILISQFVDDASFKSELEKETLKGNLDKIKTSLDSITYGGDLCYIKFENKNNADLLGSAQLSYIKTFESYFILSIEVTPSKKFKEIFDSIINTNDFGIGNIKYNKFSSILRSGYFISHNNISSSAINDSLNNLIFDLNAQVKIHITNQLKGQFHKRQLLPRIEVYEVDDIAEFEKDKLLKEYIGRFSPTFTLENKKVHIFISEYIISEDYRIRVLKEKGHGAQVESEKDLTDHDWVESYYLLQSLSLPCALDAILFTHYSELNRLKRRIYDYINESSKKGIFKRLLFLKFSQKYVDLKVSLAKNILTFKRFEEEFSNRNLRIFSDEVNLSDFKRVESNKFHPQQDSEDLQSYFQKIFRGQIAQLSKKISTLEQVFKPIEDLSIYRTNFWLQGISIFIALLAVALTADKIIEVLKIFYYWITGR